MTTPAKRPKPNYSYPDGRASGVSATRTVATRPQVDANAVRAAFLAGKKRAEIYASMPVGQREGAQRLLTRMASKWAREAEGMMAERTAGKISIIKPAVDKSGYCRLSRISLPAVSMHVTALIEAGRVLKGVRI